LVFWVKDSPDLQQIFTQIHDVQPD